MSGAEFPGKPVALFHASARSLHGRAALAEVPRTMSAPAVLEFTLPLLGRTLPEAEAMLTQPDSRVAPNGAVERFAERMGPPWTVSESPHM